MRANLANCVVEGRRLKLEAWILKVLEKKRYSSEVAHSEKAFG